MDNVDICQAIDINNNLLYRGLDVLRVICKTIILDNFRITIKLISDRENRRSTISCIQLSRYESERNSLIARNIVEARSREFTIEIRAAVIAMWLSDNNIIRNREDSLNNLNRRSIYLNLVSAS